MNNSDFCHIHNHTHFSKFDGYSSVKGLVQAAKEMGHSAVGLTDHGTLAGTISFLKECRKGSDEFAPEPGKEDKRKLWQGSYKNGIRPIVGMEAYLSNDHTCHSNKGQPSGRKGNKHTNVIAKNFVGFQNLCELSQVASLEGTYYDPRIDLSLLDKYKEGLIVTSACLSNIINNALANDEYDKAKMAVGGFKEIFGDDFYLEAMYHGIDLEQKILPDIQKLGREMDVKIIVTNDCHYIKQSDAEFQEVLMCMSSGRSVKDPKRIKFPYQEFYFKSTQEMQVGFGHMPESMMNTLDLADKCDYGDLVFVEDGGAMRLPKFKLPSEFKSSLEYLNKLAWDGFHTMPFKYSSVHTERLKRELADVKLVRDTMQYDFSTYFLIHEDVMRMAKKRNIAAGIRGSGYGSLLVRCLGISEGVDPIEQNLMWERFLGFDDKHFFSEDDFGIEEIQCEE